MERKIEGKALSHGRDDFQSFQPRIHGNITRVRFRRTFSSGCESGSAQVIVKNKKEKGEFWHNGRRMSKKRTVNGQRNCGKGWSRGRFHESDDAWARQQKSKRRVEDSLSSPSASAASPLVFPLRFFILPVPTLLSSRGFPSSVPTLREESRSTELRWNLLKS